MSNLYDAIVQLTSQTPPVNPRVLNDFASELGWQPSDRLDVVRVMDVANAHLVVEHGLENTAVITFLKQSRKFSDLNYSEKNSLLNISYNNLVDWHIQVHPEEVTFVFNRTDPLTVQRFDISRNNFDKLRSEAFEQVAGKRPNPNLPALDDALINTISHWKRNLSAEMDNTVSNEDLSALFNSIIFIRAVEDHFRATNSQVDRKLPTLTSMPEQWISEEASRQTVRQFIIDRLNRSLDAEIPAYLLDDARLRTFDTLDRQTIYAFLSDFYRNKFAPNYEYDFSLISKHALSRIYEHYVSLLRIEEVSPYSSLSLFPRLPEEERNKAYGSVYTPQFLARFFGRYLREQMPPLAFRRIKAIDPACGSGIFLRTLLELQCDPAQREVTTDLIKTSFQNTYGLDVDSNACRAAQLSLALLHLILTNNLPSALKINSAETIEYFPQHPEYKSNFDAVIANPPFVPWKDQSPEMREHLTQFMGEDASGRIDLYLAFLRIGLDMLKPGGYGLFVLPHNFLLGENARGMRNLLYKQTWVRCLADLSAIRVFEETQTYVILLIFQKKHDLEEKPPAATIVKCQELVSRALQDTVEGKRVESSFYSIYDVDQNTFADKEWLIVPPAEALIKRKFAELKTLGEFMDIRKGLISGANDVFIITSDQIPSGENEIFKPFLHDRDMKPYKVPVKTGRSVFYPYLNGQKLMKINYVNIFLEHGNTY